MSKYIVIIKEKNRWKDQNVYQRTITLCHCKKRKSKLSNSEYKCYNVMKIYPLLYICIFYFFIELKKFNF